ncbi:hypothetical protein Tco_0059515 [Tanacetum coccineum]
MLFIMLSWKRVAKIVHQCWHRVISSVESPDQDTLTPNLTVNSSTSVSQNPPYTYQWAEKTVPVAEGSSETTTERYMENYKNVSQDIRDQLNAEAEAVQIILTGIDNDIYSTVDACPNACEMWKAIERLKQGESINVQDLETNLYWEFGKFTSRDGESLESYYSRFYKMMNELSQELKTVSYHKLYDILKQHQNEVNEIRTERLARTANPLALVAQQQPVYHHQNHPTQNTYIIHRSHQSYQKPRKYTKHTNNNTAIFIKNTSRANQDNSPRINKGTGYDNQRAVNVAGARENVGTLVVQKYGIQCYTARNMGSEAGVKLKAETRCWQDDTVDESEEQELGDSTIRCYMAQILEVTPD